MAYVLIENGIVVQKQQNDAAGFFEVSDDVVCGMLFDGSNYSSPPPTPKSIDELRVEAYGSIGNQLDMIYKDQVNGTTTFKDHVAAVKAAHPKP